MGCREQSAARRDRATQEKRKMTTDATHANRRIHSRRAARIAARVVQDGESAAGTIENIGSGGVFFATEDLETVFDEATPVRLVFEGSRDGTTLTFEPTGTVLRAERYFDGSSVVRAFAVKFDGLLDLDGVEFGG
jgi:hypothetical protein